MKPLLPTFAFIGVTSAVIGFFGCSTTPLYTGQPFEAKLGDPDAHPPKYVELKPGAEGRLRAALARIKSHGGVCEITFLSSSPNSTPDPHYCDRVGGTLRTERVIKSESTTKIANNIPAPNDPNLMYRVASPSPTDLSAVLNLLQ